MPDARCVLCGAAALLYRARKTDGDNKDMWRAILAAGAIAAMTTSAFAEDAVIRQHDHVFDPVRLKIKAGTTVHFTNSEKVIHHVYAESGEPQFDSGDIQPGSEFAIAFNKPGHVVVRCAIHPAMRAEIDVEN